MNRTFGSLLAVVAAGGMAFVAAAGTGSTTGASKSANTTSLTIPAAYTVTGTPAGITAADRKAGITEGVTFSNSVGTVTVLSDVKHRAIKITVNSAPSTPRVFTVAFKSRSGYNYSCSTRQAICYPARPYDWSWLSYANTKGTTTRLNPGLGESIPRTTEYRGKSSFVFAGNGITARMVLTSDGLVTYVKKLERTSGYYKFYLKDGTTTTCDADAVTNCGFEDSLNWYKVVEIFTGSGSGVAETTVWRADVQGLAKQAAEN